MKKYFYKNLQIKNLLGLLGVLILGLVITFTLAFYYNQNAKKHILHELEIEALDLKGKIQSRLNAHVQFSRSAASYAMETDTITKVNWFNFVEKSKIAESLVGFQGIGHIINLPKSKLSDHLQHYKKELGSNYKVYPIESDSDYTPIIYIEPLKNNNLKAVGFNVSSNSLMKEAIEKARDLNESVFTDKVVLIQEGESNEQPGIVIYSPIYKKGFPINTIDQRRVAIKSWVGSSFRINDLMNGILGVNKEQETFSQHIQIYDGDKVLKENILYDNSNSENINRKESPLNTLVLPIELNGKKWTLKFKNSRINLSYGNMFHVVIICGLIISVLLGFLIFSLLNTSSFAKILAEKLTRQLVEKNKENMKLSSAIEQSSNIIMITDKKSRIEYTNPKFTEISGYSAKEVLGKDPEFLSSENYDGFAEDIFKTISSGKEWKGQFKNSTKNGESYWVKSTIKALINEFGEFTNILMISEDITQ